MEALFTSIGEQLERDAAQKDDVRKIIREVDAVVRAQTALLHTMHANAATPAANAALCDRVDAMSRAQADALWRGASALVPAGESARFRPLWQYTLQSACAAAVLVHWLRCGGLATHEQVAHAVLGTQRAADDTTLAAELHAPPANVVVELDDYLMAVCALPGELTRFAVNCVIVKDFDTPARIYAFVLDLQAGLRVLNLKNDSLRKKYDGIKYEVKRLEEIIYDLRIRNLGTTAAAATNDGGGKAAAE